MPIIDKTTQVFRVLAVDDEASIREFAARALGQRGYEVRVAADGAAALHIAETETPFDLLVTDVMMPGMPGDELARRLRRSTPDLRVLYLTGFGDRLFATHPLLWDGEAFLDKPFSVPGLLEAASLLLVGRVPAPRAVRVRIPGARVRFGECLTILESLSATGGLMHLATAVPIGSTWPLILELPSQTIRVAARVVGCDQLDTPSSPALGPASFSVAFAFVNVSRKIRHALQRVIYDATAPSTESIRRESR